MFLIVLQFIETLLILCAMSEQYINVVKRSDEAEVKIQVLGFLGDWQFSAENLIPFLSAYRDEKIKLELYSLGGILIEAFAIIDYIQANNLNVSCYIFGFCGSAATVLASGCTATYMGENSFFFIHNSSNRYGESDEMNEALDRRMRILYTAKTGLDDSQLSEWMEAETMFDAEQAIELGFADGKIDDSDYLQNAANALSKLISTTKSDTMDILSWFNKKFPQQEAKDLSEVEAFLGEILEKQSSGAAEAVDAKIKGIEAKLEAVNGTKEAIEKLAGVVADIGQSVAELKAESGATEQKVEEKTDDLQTKLNSLAEFVNGIKAMKREQSPSAGNPVPEPNESPKNPSEVKAAQEGPWQIDGNPFQDLRKYRHNN